MRIYLPTKLKPEQIAEFKRLYTKHYSIELSDEEAYQKGLHLLQFMVTILELRGMRFSNDNE
jgi:hypothetical protein